MDTSTHEEGGSNTGKQDGGAPSLSLDQLKAQLEKAYTKLSRTHDQRMIDENHFGAIFDKIIDRVKAEGLTTVQEWVEDNDLPFTYGYAKGCARFSRSYDQYKEAHKWRQSAEANGWLKPKKAGGWEYAMETIRQHAAWKAGKLPPSPEQSAPQQPNPTKGPDKEAADTTLSMPEHDEGDALEADRGSVVVQITDAPEGRDALLARRDALSEDIRRLKADLATKQAELTGVESLLAALDIKSDGEAVH